MRVLALFVFLLWSTVVSASPLKVVTTFSILADMTRQIGGNDVTVTSLVGVNGDLHTYQPTPKDLKAIAEADVVILHGLGLEGWMPRLLETAEAQAVVVTASKGYRSLIYLHHHHDDKHHHGSIDPHIWQSVGGGKAMGKAILLGLEKADPKRREAYRNRAAVYQQSLKTLDIWIQKQWETISIPQRHVLTTHDAFAYYGAAYGVKFFSLLGAMAEDDASAKQIALLNAQVQNGNIRAVFAENISKNKMVENLAKDNHLVMGGKLYTDALSAANQPASTYQGLLKANTKTLIAALKQP